MKRLVVRLGGSNRKLDRQLKALEADGIHLNCVGYSGRGHGSNQDYITEDTEEVRMLVKKVGGRIPKQYERLE